MDRQIIQPLRYHRRARLLRLVHALGGPPLLLRLAGLFYRLRVEGQEHIPLQGAVIFAINHASPVADGLAYLVVQRNRPQVFLFDMYLVKDQIAGLFGALGLDGFDLRQLFASQRQGLSAAGLLGARQELLRGGAVAIFPEGELTWDGRLQSPLRRGAAWLALNTAAPVLPVVSRGGYDIQPLWDIEKIRLTGRMSIRFGQPVHLTEGPLSNISTETLQSASARLWQTMDELAK